MAEQPKQDLFDLDNLSQTDFAEMPDPFQTDERDQTPAGEKYVVFRIDQKDYAIPAERVSEVVRMLPVTGFPNLSEWFIGIANLRGDILTVVELPVLWDIEFEGVSPKAKLVVLKASDSKTNIAFRVDRLREIIVLDKDQMRAPTGRNKSHFTGVSTYKDKDISVLNVDAIISSLAIN